MRQSGAILIAVGVLLGLAAAWLASGQFRTIADSNTSPRPADLAEGISVGILLAGGAGAAFIAGLLLLILSFTRSSSAGPDDRNIDPDR